jgi:hypothetical protein
MTKGRYSFTLDRPGVATGYRVKPRLRWVDTITVIADLPALGVAAFLCFQCWRWDDQFGLGLIDPRQWTFFPIMGILAVTCLLAATFATRTALRLIFLTTGMLTPEEARHYPLKASKEQIDPWPECWLEPDFATADVFAPDLSPNGAPYVSPGRSEQSERSLG